jgi:aminoglycoside phosphotransferase
MDLIEPLTEPLQNRLDFIRVHKAYDEIPYRLRLIDVVKGELPAAVVTAAAARTQAIADRVATMEAESLAYAVRNKAISAFLAADAEPTDAKLSAVRSAAEETYLPTWKAYTDATMVAAQASDDLENAFDDGRDAIEALHKTEHPDCPWDGRTIFPLDKS